MNAQVRKVWNCPYYVELRIVGAVLHDANLVECAQRVMCHLYDGADLDDVDLTCGGHTLERPPFFLGE